ncbi:MAG: DUF4127 family protein [Oscillochloris sp.]|nr:DUF4127 family protein [Oscillochloris sp.]
MSVIGYIPLDERPVNTRYPAMIAQIAAAELRQPPAELLSNRREPGDHAGLVAWLAAQAPQLDGLIVSLEQLAHGGLIPSRISHEPATTILNRLEMLRKLRSQYPHLPLYAFSVITRVSNANDAVEEPDYWAAYGERLYRFSQLIDRQRHGQTVAAELAALERELPAELRRDMLLRRLRNHVINGAALHMLAEGIFDLLVLSSDDTSPFGLPARERQFLAEWADLTNVERLLMYPGADEIGCALLARMLNEQAGIKPKIALQYVPPAAAANIAAYEDGPVSATVERQIMACGAVIAADADAEIWLGVHTPFAHRDEWSAERAAADRSERRVAIRDLVRAAQAQHIRGRAVAIADVAYPNGADPVLIAALRNGLELPQLTAYGAWNTAGNTIGTVIAQACAVQHVTTDQGRAAQERFLVQRFVEDWGYQQLVRRALRNRLREIHNMAEPATPEVYAESIAWIEQELNTAIGQLPGFADRWRIRPGSVSLPWRRTFEVDFELEQV